MLYLLVFLTLWTQWENMVEAQLSQCNDLVSFRNILPKGCGTMGSVQYVAGGRAAARDELPWQAAVYSKKSRPYMQICGGSVITNAVVLSAAHCFWSDLEKLLPAEDYAVAVNKLYRPWSDPQDSEYVQKSDVREIRVPPRYQGSVSNFQDDLAVLVLTTPFRVTARLVPICLNFSYELDTRQLTPGSDGKVAGWGRTGANAAASPTLQVAYLPYVDIQECINKIDPAFLPAITSDKICAGYTDAGIAVCKGDSGGGLSFYDNSTSRYYLRGVVSTAPKSEDLCNIYTYATFTHVIKHEYFIMSVLSETQSDQPPSSRTSGPQNGFNNQGRFPTTFQNTTNVNVLALNDGPEQFEKTYIAPFAPIRPNIPNAEKIQANIPDDNSRQFNIPNPSGPYDEYTTELGIPQTILSYDGNEKQFNVQFDTNRHEHFHQHPSFSAIYPDSRETYTPEPIPSYHYQHHHTWHQ